MNIALYTTVFGDYNPLVTQNITIDKYCITDNPSLQGEGWNKIPVKYPRIDLHPRLRAKYHKLNIHPKLQEYKYLIYIDSNVQIVNPDFLDITLDLLKDNDIVFGKHPISRNWLEEIDACKGLNKYKNDEFNAAKEYYLENYGKLVTRKVPWMGMFAVRQDQSMALKWIFNETLKYCMNDQIAATIFKEKFKFLNITQYNFINSVDEHWNNKYYKLTNWRDDEI